MWIKIAVVHSDQKVIYLPPSFALELGATTAIRFGGRSAQTAVNYQNNLEITTPNAFDAPATVKLSDKLQDELCLPQSPVYQLRIVDSQIILGPVIGFLLGNAVYRYNPKHMTKYSDRFGIYPKIGGITVAFAPSLIHWDNHTVDGLYYNHLTAEWEYGRFPLPEVIYRRDFHSDPALIQQLIDYTGGRLFNSYRFTKYELFSFLRRDSELREYLPPTEYTLNFDQIFQFIHDYQKVILKPVHLSRGRGICIIEKIAGQYRVVDFRCKQKQPTIYQLYNDDLLHNFFAVYQDLFSRYLIQKYLSLAKVANSPFDIRAVMHKHPDQGWGCTGIECRVSNNGYLTNISRGGYALTLEEALQQAFPRNARSLAAQIHEFCRKFCRCMDTFGEHFAEFGMDIALDRDQKLWLIEANVFPSFKGFKKMDLATYLAIRYNPMLYAASLTPFGAG